MHKMSRVILAAGLLLLSALASLLPHEAGAAKSTSRALLLNGDFERTVAEHPWMPTAWDTSMADLPTVFFGRDSFLVHGGKWAVSVANMSTAFPLAHNWHQAMLVGPEAWGKMASFKVWTRSNGLEGRAYLVVQAYNDTASRMGRIWGVEHDEALKRLNIGKLDDPLIDLGWKRVQFDDPLTEWVPREARAFVPVGTNMLFARLGLMGSGQVLFDDASLTFEPAPPATPYPANQNLYAEPSFEQHGLAWDLAIPPYEGSKVEVDSTVAHTGRKSLRISDFSDGLVEARIGAGQPFEGRRLRGKRVRLSGWYKGDSLIGTCYVKVYSHGLHSRVRQSPGAELLSGTWDWKELSIEYDIPEDSELVWANLVASAPARGTVWIDDARFEVIGPSRTPPKPAPKPAAKPASKSTRKG
ncbi:MAG: hypothetical protein ABL977_04650 [Candidatus Eisenbacteria bacterium]